MEIIFECFEDNTYPLDVKSVDQIKEVYVDSMIGWLVVSDFTYTRNGNIYKFVI
jgi:hypothetical protein